MDDLSLSGMASQPWEDWLALDLDIDPQFDPLEMEHTWEFQDSHAFGDDPVNLEHADFVALRMLDLGTSPSVPVAASEPRLSLNDEVEDRDRDSSSNLTAAERTPSENQQSLPYDSDEMPSITSGHYGPGCWLSVCSPQGVLWVQRCTGVDNFAVVGADLTAAWAKQLRLERSELSVRTPEPSSAVAWRYSDAYFERSVDALFEVVYRQDFESRLRSHLEGKRADDDPAFYALRNTVYASGCRLYHSVNPAANFTAIQDEAWAHFSNALSVHSDLLHRRPSLQAVRALLAMAIFAEGLGSPALGSGLIANATFLAQSLGLHRKDLSPEGVLGAKSLQRAWLFWAVYCCEKNISRRTGRPSVIDDADIDCPIPTSVHTGSTIDPDSMKYIIQSCQVSSRICKKLMSTQRLDSQPAKLLDTVADLEKQLNSWRHSLPSAIRPQECLTQCQGSPLSKSQPATLLQCSYYDLTMVLHAPFSYPWITQHFRYESGTYLGRRINGQIARSSDATANAARSIIIMARDFEIDGANTNAFMLHYPMHAFINLFIYVLRFPSKRATLSDLALLDVAAGYFGQLEFVTGSTLSFSFSRDIAALGRRVVTKGVDLGGS